MWISVESWPKSRQLSLHYPSSLLQLFGLASPVSPDFPFECPSGIQQRLQVTCSDVCVKDIVSQGAETMGLGFPPPVLFYCFLNVKPKQLLVFVSSVLQLSCLGMGVWVRGQSKWYDWCCPLNWPSWASLVVQWLRIHLAMQGTPV